MAELGSVLGLRCLWLPRSDPNSGRGDGACTRIRTRDQLIKSQLLYQLSYAGAPAILASLDLGLRRSTTSSNHPLAFCQPARRSWRGSSTCSLELSGFTMTTSKMSSKFTLKNLISAWRSLGPGRRAPDSRAGI